MAFVNVKKVGLRGLLEGKREFAKAPLKKIGTTIGESIKTSALREEISKERWLPSTGGVRPWKEPTFPRPPGSILGGVSGSYGRAVDAATIDLSKLFIRVTMTDPHPGSLRTHLGGAGLVRREKVTVIRPKTKPPSAMRAAIGFKSGVFISDETLRKGLQVPSRPFFSIGPKLLEESAAVVAKAGADA